MGFVRSGIFRPGIPIIAAAAMLAVLATGLNRRADLPVRDAILELRAANPAIRTSVVAIDQRSIDEIGPWPWPRQKLASLIESIRTAEPRGIVIDLLLVDPRPGDASFATTLAPEDTVLAATLDDEGAWLLPVEPLRQNARLAHASLDLDHDGVMRQVMSTRQADGISLPALSVSAAMLAEPGGSQPVARLLEPDFSTRQETIPVVGAESVMSRSFDRQLLSETLVFVGVTALGLGDRVVTPVSEETTVPGVFVHASVAESLLQGNLLRAVPPWASALLAALVVAIAMRLDSLEGWKRIGAEACLIAAPAVVGSLLLLYGSVVTPLVTLTLVAFASVLSVEIHSVFFTSRKVAETEAALLGGSSPPDLAPERRVENLLHLAEKVGKDRNEETASRRALAHELKTPLTSMRGLAQLLGGFDLSEEEKKRVAALMVRETTRLQALVEQLLDIERIHLADFDQAAEPTDLTSLVNERIEMLRGDDRNPIRASVKPALRVRGRPELLSLILDNLVGNARKYSPAGSAVEVRLTSSTSGEISLEVEDAGPGIPPDERQTIFRRFSRGTTAKGTEGLGLGLALVREIATWHRGTVDVRPARFRGSIFRLRLPAAGNDEEVAAS